MRYQENINQPCCRGINSKIIKNRYRGYKDNGCCHHVDNCQTPYEEPCCCYENTTYEEPYCCYHDDYEEKSLPPCPPNPGDQSAHFGYEEDGKAYPYRYFNDFHLGGLTGGIPFNTVYELEGCDITGPHPIYLCGGHTYLVEWSGSIDPVDADASVQVEILVDGIPIRGSGAYTDITRSIDGFVSLSGGAIIRLEGCKHVLSVRYISGINGIDTKDLNIRIVQIN